MNLKRKQIPNAKNNSLSNRVWFNNYFYCIFDCYTPFCMEFVNIANFMPIWPSVGVEGGIKIL